MADEKEIFNPKMRIQLLNENGTIKSDRLVNQSIEFNTGPKDSHKGATRFEITFQDKQDIDNFFAYLDKLRSDLPQRDITSRGRKPGEAATKSLETPRENIILDVEKMAKDGKVQDDIIKYLRGLDFVMILTEDFLIHEKNFPFKSNDIGEPNSNGQYPDSIVWMARRIKKSKTNPSLDKYDSMVLFGIQILKKKRKFKLVPYLYKERKEVISLDIKEGNKNSFSLVKEFTKFPHYMTEEERLKFQAEYRMLIANQEKEPSKFFTRWSQDVYLSKDIYKGLKHLVDSGKASFKNDKA